MTAAEEEVWHAFKVAHPLNASLQRAIRRGQAIRARALLDQIQAEFLRETTNTNQKEK